MSFYGQYPGNTGGGGSGSALASGTSAIPNASNTVTVNYDVTLSSPIAPLVQIINTADANPIFLIPVIIAFSTTGFTAKFNAPTDSANYSIQYAVFGAV